MRAFRIADSRHSIWDGTGAFLNGGRWNSRGSRVIYASPSYAGALLEQLAHANTGRLPRSQAYIEIEIPEDLPMVTISVHDIRKWDESDFTATRERGDRWHRARESLVLMVPSVVTGGIESNLAINQDHPDFPRIRVSDPKPVRWDPRLVQS